MPSTNQVGSDKGEYETHQERMLREKSLALIKCIKPQRMETAQAWATAASQVGAKQEVIDHFVGEIKRLSD